MLGGGELEHVAARSVVGARYDEVRQVAYREAKETLENGRTTLTEDRQYLETERQNLEREKSNVSSLINTLRKDLAAVSAQNSASAARIGALETSLEGAGAKTRKKPALLSRK
jgi:predicted  nucleic acid-binding Zn-ribbon protein